MLKKTLMDQKFVAGLGNIYVNEILFKSNIKPTRKIKNLEKFEIEKIVKNTKEILKKAIRMGDHLYKIFLMMMVKKGIFQQSFKVYGRKGYRCSNIDCKKSIIRVIISNRSSFYCPSCQK